MQSKDEIIVFYFRIVVSVKLTFQIENIPRVGTEIKIENHWEWGFIVTVIFPQLNIEFTFQLDSRYTIERLFYKNFQEIN